METNFSIGGLSVESYKKPVILSTESINGAIPAIFGLAGLSAAKLAVVGAAAGLAVGAASKKGGSIIHSEYNHSFINFKPEFAM